MTKTRTFEGWSPRIVRFFSEVSIGGMRFIVADESNVTRIIIWCFLVLGGTSFMGYHITRQVLLFLSYPTTTSVEINYEPTINQKGIHFPVVTICDQNLVSRMVADIAGFPPEVVIGVYPFEESKFVLETDEILASRKVVDEALVLADQSIGSDREAIIEFYSTMNHNITVLQCRFNGENCGDEFKQVHTSAGLCFQLNSNRSKRQMKAGSMFGLKLYLLINQSDYLANPTGSAGFQLLLHPATDAPEVENKAIQVAPGKHTKLAVESTVLSSMPPPHGICEDKFLSFYDTYSLSRCEAECRANYTLQFCKCVPHFYPNVRKDGEKLPLCKPSKYACYEEARDDMTKKAGSMCGCTVQCRQEIYKAFVSSAPLSQFFANTVANEQGNDFSSEDLLQNYLKVDVYFNELSYRTVRQQESYSIFQLFCDIGGAMSLILGSTFLTCFEFVDFAVFTAWLQVQSKPRHKPEHRPKPTAVRPYNGAEVHNSTYPSGYQPPVFRPY